jgi:hypothetical protein
VRSGKGESSSFLKKRTKKLLFIDTRDKETTPCKLTPAFIFFIHKSEVPESALDRPPRIVICAMS